MEKTLATVKEILNELKQTKQTDEFGIFEELRQKTDELAIEANECFVQRIEEDFVSLWISHINFGMRSQRILGGFEYNTENLKFGPLGIRLCVKQLSDEELDEILNFYCAKGYTLNRTLDIIMSNPDTIVINWEHPKKQTILNRISILKFKIIKFKKFYRYHRKRKNVIVSFFVAFFEFIEYFYAGENYCLNATKQYKKSKKNEKRLERLHKSKRYRKLFFNDEV